MGIFEAQRPAHVINGSIPVKLFMNSMVRVLRSVILMLVLLSSLCSPRLLRASVYLACLGQVRGKKLMVTRTK